MNEWIEDLCDKNSRLYESITLGERAHFVRDWNG